MTHVKYTREMLSEAVAASTSMAACCATSASDRTAAPMLTCAAASLNSVSIHRTSSARPTCEDYRTSVDARTIKFLVVRPVDAKRERPATLRRALEETGRPYLCAECGIGDQWNGRPLTLHIDHIDGQFWDCRPENVRFLCPTCHSQTATYAGRNRRPSTDTYVLVDALGNPVTQTEPTGPLSDERKLEILALVNRGEMAIADAARALGRKRQYVYELQRRLATRGSLHSAGAQASNLRSGSTMRRRDGARSANVGRASNS